jgi:hypothetical protein
MNVDIYFNLRKHCLSVRSKGKVVSHQKSVVVNNPCFVVSAAGRARVLKEKRKNVHAFVRGEAYPVDISCERFHKLTTMRWKMIKYNPYKFSSFVLASNETPVSTADIAIIRRNIILALNPK